VKFVSVRDEAAVGVAEEPMPWDDPGEPVAEVALANATFGVTAGGGTTPRSRIAFG
jgi:hypothetical protein